MRQLEERQRWRHMERLAGEAVTPRTQAVARLYLGRAVLDRLPEEALTHLRRARPQLTRMGEPWLAAEARGREAAALYLLESADALDAGRDGLARFRMLTDRDPSVEAQMLAHIGTYQVQREEVAAALGSHRQAIARAGSRVDLARLATIYPGSPAAAGPGRSTPATAAPARRREPPPRDSRSRKRRSSWCLSSTVHPPTAVPFDAELRRRRAGSEADSRASDKPGRDCASCEVACRLDKD